MKKEKVRTSSRPDPNSLWGFSLVRGKREYFVDGCWYRPAVGDEHTDAHFTVWDDYTSGPIRRQGFVKVVRT